MPIKIKNTVIEFHAFKNVKKRFWVSIPYKYVHGKVLDDIQVLSRVYLATY